MSEEMEMIERAQAMPAGYVEHKVFSEYSSFPHFRVLL